jgi:MerR family transcriptional regulator, copper efflux regulator
MKIGALSKQTGVSVRAIRHYDQMGLLTSQREENGYRSFSPEDVKRVQLIRLFLSIGFQLDEIRKHGPCWKDEVSPLEDTPVALTVAFYERKLEQLNGQIDILQEIRNRLESQVRTLREHL